MYDPVKTPSICSIYSYNHLPPLLFSFIFHPSLSTNGGGPLDKMVEKKVQKMVQKVVQKKVHKIVQGSNGPVHILPPCYQYDIKERRILPKVY